MISFEEALELHELSVKVYGGSAGIRDIEGLKSALARPYATFDGQYLYDDAIKRRQPL